MYKLVISLVLLLISVDVKSQNNFWADASSNNFRTALKERQTSPDSYRLVSLDTQSFLSFASNARDRFDINRRNVLVLTLPMPNGDNESFTLENSELMHPELAARFPELKTYSGKGIDDKTAIIRITYSPYFGFSGMILSGKHSTVYIDPITQDNLYYMSYYRENLPVDSIDFACYTDQETSDLINQIEGSQRVDALGDCNLRRYRLAQSCTGEYAQYHIAQAGGSTGNTANDKAIVQAAMNVTMNRVNGVYERDLGITMQFVANNDLIIYLNANSDPWSNEWNTTTAQTIDAQIGVNNYDIGHNFNTTGGGNAGCIDCVCLSNSQSGTHKGRGYTGRAAPVGDPFDIDYVAHEMGHQFGGYHTQSSSNCRSGDGTTEVEPGSASTIMGYAGICAANVQSQSDDYFAYVNIRDIVTSINFGNASGCAELISSGNSGPTADAGPNFSIPISTPFKLEGIGMDSDDSGLTYCWEQNDPENPNSAAAPSSTRTVGPMFRSLLPVSEPYRYMPNITAIVNNSSPTFEVLPSVSRSMEFSFLVRDNNSASGCTASDLMTVNTVASAGPFLVTSPNTNVTWNAGTTQNITWDVAGTTSAPINCTEVDIYLSTDGGFTYPITIATGVANNGSFSFVVPNNQGSQNRIMVKGADNIFFDISNNNFTIGTPIECTANVPTGLAVSNIGATSATLTWDEVSGAFYDLRYREVGNITWTTVPVFAFTSNINGLTPETNYEAQVRSNCSEGGTSAYSSSVNFTTIAIPPCIGAQITSYPYLETFDSGIGDWTQGAGDDGDWTLDANGTPSSGTGPSDDITGGGNYYFLEASNNGSTGEVGSNATVLFISPCYDLSSLNEAYFSFYYHMFGTSVGELNLEISSDNGGNWDNIFSASGNQGNIWTKATINLNTYLGQSVKFRFVGLTGNGWSSDIAIDHINLTDIFVPDYCVSNGNNTDDEYIGRVQINTIDNNNLSAGITSQGYSDHTNLSTDLYSGTQYNITITPVWTGPVYNEGYAVWIDYNFDGDFDDVGELVWSQPITQNTPVSGSFIVPDDIAFEKSTRMRVSLKYNGIPTACESFDYGEVEDYTINLKYDGLLFINNAWIPNAPSELTGSNNALVYNGTYTMGTNVQLNDLTINSAAILEVQEIGSLFLNGDFTNNGDLTLNSVSNQYSSLIVNGLATGDVSYRRHVNINASSGGNDLIAAPVTGQNFGDFANNNPNIFSNPSNPSEKLFGPFDKVSESYLTYDTDIPSEASITLDPGTGYRAASTNNSTFTFKGVVNTSNINIGIQNSGTIYPEWNLIGNPYPSYIKLSDFLNDNVSEFLPTSAAVYGYDGDASDGWVIWNLAYALANPDALITPGQGFLVSSKVGGGSITFSPDIRTIGSSDDFISGRNSQRNNIAHLSLQMTNNSDSFNTDFYFTDFATRGMDVGYDATVFNGMAPNFAIYSALVENHQGSDIAVQSVGYDEFNQNIVIPLGINAPEGQQITVGIETNSLPNNINVYLEDNLLNSFTLLNDSDYVHTTANSLSGIGRFFLHFESQTLTNPEHNLDSVLIFTQSNPKTIVIKGLLTENTVAKVYDIQGRLVLASSLEQNSTINEIGVENIASGVYVIQMESSTHNKSQKVIIN